MTNQGKTLKNFWNLTPKERDGIIRELITPPWSKMRVFILIHDGRLRLAPSGMRVIPVCPPDHMIRALTSAEAMAILKEDTLLKYGGESAEWCPPPVLQVQTAAGWVEVDTGHPRLEGEAPLLLV